MGIGCERKVIVMENLFGTLWKYIINFSKEKLTTVVWIVLGSAITLFSPPKLLQIVYIDNLPKFILSFIGFILVLSSTLLVIIIAKEIFSLFKNKICKIKQRNLDKTRAHKVKGFIKEFGNGYNSRDECLNWGNKVLPNIKFNKECYNKFKGELNSIVYLEIKEELFLTIQKSLKQYLLRLLEQLRHSSKD